MKTIRELRAGEEIISFFVLRNKRLKTKRDSDETYASFELGDATGRIFGSLWENVQSTYDAVKVGNAVKVKSKIVEYHDRLHLHIEKMRAAEESDQVDYSKLIPAVQKDREKLMSHLDALIESIKEPHLHQLLTSIFEDKEIRRGFYDAPAGKLWHHGYLGGLLEHSLAVTDICDRIGTLYSGVNRDLLVTGGLLHDIGKIQSYSYKTLIDYSDEGRLIGHIVLGSQMVEERIHSLKSFPPALKTQLLHLILSHQGKLEQASPVVPMTLEAIILYYADEIDSKANAFERIRSKEKKFGTKWSSFVRLMDRYFYLGDETEGGQSATE